METKISLVGAGIYSGNLNIHKQKSQTKNQKHGHMEQVGKTCVTFAGKPRLECWGVTLAGTAEQLGKRGQQAAGGAVADAGNGQQAVRFVPPLAPKKQQSHYNKHFRKIEAEG